MRPRDGDSLPLSTLERHRTPREDWAEAAGGGNYVRVLDDGVCYLSLDDMDDLEGKTFEALTREVFAQLERTDTHRLIVDLRRNGGGNNYFGEALRKGIGHSHINRPGGLYVLIGPQTFSAAQNLANRLERETFALFIGEPTGGSPNHYGDAKVTVGRGIWSDGHRLVTALVRFVSPGPAAMDLSRLARPRLLCRLACGTRPGARRRHRSSDQRRARRTGTRSHFLLPTRQPAAGLAPVLAHLIDTTRAFRRTHPGNVLRALRHHLLAAVQGVTGVRKSCSTRHERPSRCHTRT